MSSIQFNLLPSSKYAALANEAKDSQLVRKVVLAALACVALFVLLLAYTEGVQKVEINNISKDINTKTSKLQKVSNINAILTIQNQLQTAAVLHQNQHDSSRIFGYMSQLTPPNASISSLSLDMANNVIKIEGTADTATTVNAFIDTLKYTNYKVGNSAAKAAFSSVIENNFTIGQTGVSYSITANFDPKLFANNLTDANGSTIVPQLVVPNSTNTRTGNDPGSLFGGGQ